MIDLFKPISKDLVTTMVLEGKKKAEEMRKLEAGQKLAIFHDDWKDILKLELSNHFHKKNYERMHQSVDISDNLLKKAIETISQVYNKPVTRSYGKDSKFDFKLFFGKGLSQDVFWSRVNQYTELLNDMIIHPAWMERTKTIRPILLTPDIVEVTQMPDNPEEAASIWYEVHYLDTADSIKSYIYYWSYFNHYVIDVDKNVIIDNPKNPKNLNPYKDEKGNPILPFVFIHKKQIPGSFWNPKGGADLFEGTVSTGVKRTNKNFLAKVNSFKQLIFTGLPDSISGSMVFSPLSVINLEDGGTANVMDYTADFKGLSDNIKEDVNAILETYGLKSSDFKSPEAAKALIIKNQKLKKIREGQIPYMRQAEINYHYIARIVYNYHAKKKIRDELKIDYPEIEVIEDPRDLYEFDKKKVKDGLMHIGDFFRKYNPDIKNRDDAFKMVKDNMEAKKKWEDTGLSINDIVKIPEGEL